MNDSSDGGGRNVADDLTDDDLVAIRYYGILMRQMDQRQVTVLELAAVIEFIVQFKRGWDALKGIGGISRGILLWVTLIGGMYILGKEKLLSVIAGGAP